MEIATSFREKIN